MRRPPPIASAAAVLVVSTSAWVGLQALLASAHGRESAAEWAVAIARNPNQAPGVPPDTGVSYWGPLVLMGALQVVALAVLALALVWAGRRWSWALLGLPLFVRPSFSEPAITWLHPIGYGWSGPWVHAGTPMGQAQPSITSMFALSAIGAVVDLLVVALPAVVYLALSRRAARPEVVSWIQVLRRLALPVGLVVAASVGYGLVNLNGGDAQRTIPALIVPLAAGLLATTRLGAVLALAVVGLISTLASNAAGYLVAPSLHDNYSPYAWGVVAGYALPLLALAFVGAVAGAHGPVIAAVYRQLVRRPAPAVKAMHA